MKIVVLDGHGVNPGDMSWTGIEELGELVVFPRTQPNEVVAHVGDAEIALTNKTEFTSEIISALPNTKYIGVLATGYNVVDIDAASKHNIVVINIPAYSTDSVAQMTFAHILNVTNRVGHYSAEFHDKKWCECSDFCYWNTPLIEIAGKRLGIVGLGNIGMKVARIAHDFGMEVSAFTSKDAVALPQWLNKVSLDELFGGSDFISLHCPLTPSTQELINHSTISKMRKGVVLINTGRGKLVNENDIAVALREGQIGAYCADVMCSEPPSADNPLLGAKNCFITPHVAWATMEARARLMKIAEENIKNFIKGNPINVVNNI